LVNMPSYGRVRFFTVTPGYFALKAGRTCSSRGFFSVGLYEFQKTTVPWRLLFAAGEATACVCGAMAIARITTLALISRRIGKLLLE
jgi:hypothetical protein